MAVDYRDVRGILPTPITIVLSGDPQPYAERARVFGGRVWSHRPTSLQTYQAWLRNAAQIAMDGRPPLTGPVKLTLTAFMPIPKSMRKTDRALAELELLCHIKRPDMTQLLKCAEDACNKVVWNDDAQLCEHALSKRYSPRPRLVMIAEPFSLE